MQERINIFKTTPVGYKAMLAMEAYLNTTGIEPLHKELIKLRTSQINGCAYCLDMHSKDARKLGETEQRIYTLNAWRETPFFSATERAILALTEEVTLISNHHVSDDTYTNALNELGEKLLGEVIFAICVINSWNRIAISTHMMPVAG
jgi:AhpD family alkylhydroperoxidase